MNKRQQTIMTAAVLLSVGMMMMMLGPDGVGLLCGLLLGAGLAVLFSPNVFKKKRRGGTTRISPSFATTSSLRLPTGKLPALAEAIANKEAIAVQASALSSDHRKKQWMKTEQVVDDMLDGFINALAVKLPYHTIAIFFLAFDDIYMLRRYISKSGHVDPQAQIIPKRGLLGSLLGNKEKLRTFYEPHFTNKNATLYYYDDKHDFKPDEMVRSIMLSPIEADGDVKGILLADHTKENAYTNEERDLLSGVAKLLGQCVYYTYLNTEHCLDYQRIIAISNTEKDFWKDLEFDAVMDKMRDIIPYAIPACDRLTICLKEEDSAVACIHRVYGQETDGLLKMTFEIGDGNPRAIASVAFTKEFGFFRNFNEDRYEARFSEGEPQSGEFASFMAVPFGADSCKGLMLLESTKKDAFTNANVDLLTRIGTSAGLALEKIFIIRKADALATRDGLTGLYNHRQFQKILATKISAYSRYKETISLVLCDIDHFKKLNDTYGHPFGDTVLKAVAAKLENSIRVDIDAAARYGGEEFVLILDKTTPETAKETVERIRQSIEDMTFRTTDGTEVSKRTMSFGIASYPEHARTQEELIENADKALYSAKTSGRNRVEIY